MEFTLEMSLRRVPVGEPVEFTLRVRNKGMTPYENYTAHSKRYDIWVETSRGHLIWQRWLYAVWADGFYKETWLPGEEKVIKDTWDQRFCNDPGTGPPPPGDYVAKALWRTHDSDAGENRSWRTDPLPFSIHR